VVRIQQGSPFAAPTSENPCGRIVKPIRRGSNPAGLTAFAAEDRLTPSRRMADARGTGRESLMAEPRVFISMGTPYNETFEAFRDALEKFLRRCRADPRIIGVNEYPTGNPLAKIRDVMKSCHGVIVVAYERKYLQAGVEKRSAAAPKPLSDQAYTTPWNHIESAMAYSLGLPIYIICQRGLTEDGLIETRADWYVQHMDLTPEALDKTAVSESLRTWLAESVAPVARKPRAWKSIEGALKLSEMTAKEIWGALALVGSIFAAGAAFARWAPALIGG
jgi:hypothetical protein